MSVSVWQQAAQPTQHYGCDVVVVGGGIVGAYTAYTLAKAGKQVAILESRFPAAGATGRNAGMCLMGAADNYQSGIEKFGRLQAKELWQLTRENQRKTASFVAKFNTPWVQCGSLIAAIDETESQLLKQAYELMREDGFEVDFYPSDPLGRGFGAAIGQPNDFGIDPVALVNALIENAGEHVKLFAPAEVFAIHRIKNNRLRLDARTISVECEQIALCTNAYSPTIAPYFNDKVRPVRAQMFMTAPLNEVILEKLVYCNYGYEYFRQLDTGAFLLGGGRSLHRDLEVGYDEVATEWLQASLEQFLQKHFSDVKLPIVRRWAGTMGFSADGLPIVGQLPYVPGTFQAVAEPFAPAATYKADITPPDNEPSGIYFAVGMTGHGLGWGMVAADHMIAQMLGERNNGGLFDVARLG